MYGGRFRTSDVAGGCDCKRHQTALRFSPLRERPEHRVASCVVTLADIEDDPPRAQHSRRDEGAVEDEMRVGRHQQAVLLALGLAFCAVDDDHRPAT